MVFATRPAWQGNTPVLFLHAGILPVGTPFRLKKGAKVDIEGDLESLKNTLPEWVGGTKFFPARMYLSRKYNEHV